MTIYQQCLGNKSAISVYTRDIPKPDPGDSRAICGEEHRITCSLESCPKHNLRHLGMLRWQGVEGKGNSHSSE